MLETERQYFADHLADLLDHYRGRFVVIKDQTVIGGFATPDEALSEGARRFGLTAFLARLVTDHPAEVSIPALTLGLLHADPPRTVRGTGDGRDRPSHTA